MALQEAGRRAIGRGVTRRERFRHGNVRGDWYASWSDVPRGRLDGYHSADVDAPVYAVHSYGTPIAWTYADDESWVTPGVRYSRTTTNHQGVVGMALLGVWAAA